MRHSVVGFLVLPLGILAACAQEHAPAQSTMLFATQTQCSSCHGYPPGDYPDNMGHSGTNNCDLCHPIFTPTGIDKAKHLNGTIDYQANCLACHSARELCLLGIRQYCSM